MIGKKRTSDGWAFRTCASNITTSRAKSKKDGIGGTKLHHHPVGKPFLWAFYTRGAGESKDSG